MGFYSYLKLGRPDPPAQPAGLRLARRGSCLCLLASSLLLSGLAWADGVSREQMKGLDEQVQEIKSDVLGIAAELARLEEKLLYPSHTQVSVFVSLAASVPFRLDSLQIQIDGEAVARHVYSFQELEALRNGGVQRVFTGNLPSGDHELEVVVAGKLQNGDDFDDSASFSFEKDAQPSLVGVNLAAESGKPSIELGSW